jgi:hypothetical protein
MERGARMSVVPVNNKTFDRRIKILYRNYVSIIESIRYLCVSCVSYACWMNANCTDVRPWRGGRVHVLPRGEGGLSPPISTAPDRRIVFPVFGTWSPVLMMGFIFVCFRTWAVVTAMTVLEDLLRALRTLRGWGPHPLPRDRRDRAPCLRLSVSIYTFSHVTRV